MRKVFFFKKLFLFDDTFHFGSVILVAPKILEFHNFFSIGVTPMTSGSPPWPQGHPHDLRVTERGQALWSAHRVQRYELLKLSCKNFKKWDVRCFAVYVFVKLFISLILVLVLDDLMLMFTVTSVWNTLTGYRMLGIVYLDQLTGVAHSKSCIG